MPLHEGQLLDGKVAIVRLIAQGGMGEVYLGINQRLGKRVAVKVLQSDYARDPLCVERFEREAKISAKIRSEHVTDVFDLGELPSGERFIVMEYLEGECLADRLERETRIAPKALANLTVQICDALAAAHGAGVVHRDLKPENVFLSTCDRQDFVKLVDFGISKEVSAEGRSIRETAAGEVLGTPMYMSPEQARGTTGAIDHRSDIYSLGVILYEAACGHPPFEGDNVNALLFRIALEPVPPLAERLPGIDPAFVAIVEKAMAKAPIDRYQSADEMREAVLAWQATLSGVSATVHVGDVLRQLEVARDTAFANTAALASVDPASLEAAIEREGAEGASGPPSSLDPTTCPIDVDLSSIEGPSSRSNRPPTEESFAFTDASQSLLAQVTRPPRRSRAAWVAVPFVLFLAAGAATPFAARFPALGRGAASSTANTTATNASTVTAASLASAGVLVGTAAPSEAASTLATVAPRAPVDAEPLEASDVAPALAIMPTQGRPRAAGAPAPASASLAGRHATAAAAVAREPARGPSKPAPGTSASAAATDTKAPDAVDAPSRAPESHADPEREPESPRTDVTARAPETNL